MENTVTLLGLPFVHDEAYPQASLQRIADDLKARPRRKDYSLCILDVDNWAAKLEGWSREHIDSRAVYVNQHINFYMTRNNGPENNFSDLNVDTILLAAHPAHYHSLCRFVWHHFSGAPAIVVPYWGGTQPLSLGASNAIVAMEFPGAGTLRFYPVFNAIMNYLRRPVRTVVEPYFNNRFIRQLAPDRSGPAFRVRRGPDGTAPPAISLEAISRNYFCQFQALDDYWWASMHHPVSTELFTALPDIRFVFLMRDPRDIVNSLFHRLLHDAIPGDFGSMQQGTTEQALLDIIDGFDWLNAKGDCFLRWPSLQEMADQFCAVQELPNVYPLRFEDIRYSPREAYRALLRQLQLEDLAFLPLPDATLDEMIRLGTFEYQSGGTMKEGQTETKTIFRAAEHVISSSMRKGEKGDWKNHFSPRVKERVKEVAGNALVRLGYEKDLDW